MFELVFVVEGLDLLQIKYFKSICHKINNSLAKWLCIEWDDVQSAVKTTTKQYKSSKNRQYKCGLIPALKVGM